MWRGVNTNSRPNTHKLPAGPKPRLRFFSGTFDSPFFIAAHTERVPDRGLALWLEAILGGGWGGDVGVGIEVEVRGIGLRSVLKQQVRTWDSFWKLQTFLLLVSFFVFNYFCIWLKAVKLHTTNVGFPDENWLG